MNSVQGDDLRHEVFDAMGKCFETRSRERVIENIVQTRRLMYAIHAFYRSNPTDLITKGNSTIDELQIFASFTNNSERLPIYFDLCWLIKEQNLEEFARGYVNLRYDLIPQFIEIANINDYGTRFQLQNALLSKMRKCTGTKSTLKCLEEFYSLHSHKKPLPLRSDLRFNVFESLRMCSETYSNGRMQDNINQTKKLLTNLFVFYYPAPCEEELITVKNVTENEIKILFSFLNNTEQLPIRFELCSLLPGKSVKEFADGFSALRIELLPEFKNITSGRIKAKIFFIVKFEDSIREEIFIRKHLYKKEESDGEEDEDNGNVVDVSINNPRCVHEECASTEISSWKRNSKGKLLCNRCYESYYGIDEINLFRDRPYRMLWINGVRRNYFNLTRKLKDEFELDD